LLTSYCSKECQKCDWEKHKRTCVEAPLPPGFKLDQPVWLTRELKLDGDALALHARGKVHGPTDSPIARQEFEAPLAIPTPRNCSWGPRQIYYA
jgi:hypothetical protein